MTNPNSTIDRSLSTFRRALHRFHRNKVLGFFTLAGFGFGGVKFIFWARNDLPILAMIWVTAILLAGIFIGKKKFVFVVETSDTHQLTVPVSALYVFDHRTEANRFRERSLHSSVMSRPLKPPRHLAGFHFITESFFAWGSRPFSKFFAGTIRRPKKPVIFF
jgi:hypothetical protein